MEIAINSPSSFQNLKTYIQNINIYFNETWDICPYTQLKL